MRLLLAACLACLPLAASAAIIDLKPDKEPDWRPQYITILHADFSELTLAERQTAGELVAKIQTDCIGSLTRIDAAKCVRNGVLDAHARQEFGPNYVLIITTQNPTQQTSN